MADETLWNLAQAVLAAVEARYAAAAAPLALPARRYVSDGLPAWDCSDGQVTVRVTRTFAHDGSLVGETIGQAAVGRGAEFEVEIMRCAPMIQGKGEYPSVSAIEGSAQVVYTDAEEVFGALVDAQADGDLPGCGGVVFVGWATRGPQGGVVGGATTVRLDYA